MRIAIFSGSGRMDHARAAADPLEADRSVLTFTTKRGDEEQRFREMMLFISQLCVDHKDFSIRVMTRALYISDGIAFARWGKPITGDSYELTEYGPAPVRLSYLFGAMLGHELFTLVEPSCNTRRPIARRQPDLTHFSGEEIALVEVVTGVVMAGLSSTEKRDWRGERNGGWRLTVRGAPIPYDFLTLSLQVSNHRDIRTLRGMVPSGWNPPLYPTQLEGFAP